MGKRKLSIQQRTRIKQAQHLTFASSETETGLVLCNFGRQALVETRAGESILCLTRPNLATVVAGDLVAWQALNESKKGVIVNCHPRKTVLTRHLHKPGLQQPLAANVTQLVIVMAPFPEITWRLLDTYLITAESLHLAVCIVLNKTDLPSQALQDCLNTIYAPLGYAVFYTNQTDPGSFHSIERQLASQTSIFVGQSGVGKSSIIAKLLPHVADDIETLPLTKKNHGQHTTSDARYYHLPQGGALIDSPGVRAFHPEFLTPQHILQGYRELQPFLGQCQFRNCQHIETKGCAIQHAFDHGKISALRFQTLMKLLQRP